MSYPKMAFMNNLVSCPYNPAHRINPNRMAIHIIKCGKSHQDMKMEICPFNATHRVPTHQFQAHLVDCPDNAVVLRNVRSLQGQEDLSCSSSSSSESFDDNEDDESDFAAPSVIGVEETSNDDWMEPISEDGKYDAHVASLLSRFVRKVPSGLSKRARQRWVALDKQRVKELNDGTPFSAEVRAAFSIPEGVCSGLPDYNGPAPTAAAVGGRSPACSNMAVPRHSLINGPFNKDKTKQLPENQVKLLEIRENLVRRQRQKLQEQNQQQQQPSQLPPQPSQLPPQPSQLPPQPSQLPPQPSQLPPQPSQLPPQPSQLPPQPSQLPPQPSQLQLAQQKQTQQHLKAQYLLQKKQQFLCEKFQNDEKVSNGSCLKIVSPAMSTAANASVGGVDVTEMSLDYSHGSRDPSAVKPMREERPAFTLQRRLHEQQRQHQRMKFEQQQAPSRGGEKQEPCMQEVDPQNQREKEQLPSSTEYEKLMSEMQKMVENYQRVLSENARLRDLVMKHERCESKADQVQSKDNENNARGDNELTSIVSKLSLGHCEPTAATDRNINGTSKVVPATALESIGAIPKRRCVRSVDNVQPVNGGKRVLGSTTLGLTVNGISHPR